MVSITLLLMGWLLVLGCYMAGQRPSRAICLIIDANVPAPVDNTQNAFIEAGVGALLGALCPGDALIVATAVRPASRNPDRWIVVRLGSGPSMANAQKRAVRKQIERWLADEPATVSSNLPATLITAAENLRRLDTQTRTIVLISPFAATTAEQELESLPVQFDGITMLVLSHSAGIDGDDGWWERSERWRLKFEAAGGRWQTIENPARIPTFLPGQSQVE